MTTFNVHIYREIRLVYEGIDADSHESAATIARDKPAGDADAIEDCDGDTFYACVDVQGDEEYEQSRWIDFEPERERQATMKLLAACQRAFHVFENDTPRECEVIELIANAIAQATEETPPSGDRTFTIEVRGGLVQDVSNVPPGWDYEIIDHDNAE